MTPGERKPVDVGTFFDPPPSTWRWVAPALVGVGCVACAAMAAYGSAEQGRAMAVSTFVSLAAQNLLVAGARCVHRAMAIRSETRVREAKRTHEWAASIRRWRERRAKGGGRG